MLEQGRAAVVRLARQPEKGYMKWIILIIIITAVAIWLARGRNRKTPADPETTTIEKSNYYVRPPEEGDNTDDRKP